MCLPPPDRRRHLIAVRLRHRSGVHGCRAQGTITGSFGQRAAVGLGVQQLRESLLQGLSVDLEVK